MFSLLKKGLDAAQELSNTISGIDTSDRFDPYTSDDPIAKKVSWFSNSSENKTNTTTFTSRDNSTNDSSGGDKILVEVDESRLEYKASNISKIIGAIFITIGVIFMLLSINAYLTHQAFKNILGLSIFGIILMAVGYLIIHSASETILFDKDSGLFTKGRKESKLKFIDDPIIEFGLEKIHALQIISHVDIENKENDNNNILDNIPKIVHIYEINIITKKANRIYLTSRREDYEQIIYEANTIAEFLDVPVWNFANMTFSKKMHKDEYDREIERERGKRS